MNRISLDLGRARFEKFSSETQSKEWHARCIDHVCRPYVTFSSGMGWCNRKPCKLSPLCQAITAYPVCIWKLAYTLTYM